MTALEDLKLHYELIWRKTWIRIGKAHLSLFLGPRDLQHAQSELLHTPSAAQWYVCKASCPVSHHEYFRKSKWEAFPFRSSFICCCLSAGKWYPSARRDVTVSQTPPHPRRVHYCAARGFKMAARQLPRTFRKVIISKLSTNYREAVEIVEVPMLQPGPNDVLVKNR